MSISSREWSTQFEQLKRKVQSKRQQGQYLNTQEYKSISGGLSILESQLKTMTAAPMEYEMSASEVGRRQILLEALQRHLQLASPSSITGSSTIPMSTSASTTNPMIPGLSITTGGVSSTNYQPLPSDSPKQSFVSDRGLMQRQEQIIKLQDDMLEDIGKGVEGLKTKAQMIGEEAKIQVRLLDELDNNVENATNALYTETKHTEQVTRNKRMCYMYMCIAVEVVMLVILAIIAFKG